MFRIGKFQRCHSNIMYFDSCINFAHVQIYYMIIVFINKIVSFNTLSASCNKSFRLLLQPCHNALGNISCVCSLINESLINYCCCCCPVTNECWGERGFFLGGEL